MIFFLPTVFFIQGAAMVVDEFYFHRRRGLPLWEKFGHPLDTFSVLVCYGFLFSTRPSESFLWIYVGLCIFSCLLITKDEFVHTERCSAGENWLHAVLFVLHPVAFLVAALVWLQKIDDFFFTATDCSGVYFFSISNRVLGFL